MSISKRIFFLLCITALLSFPCYAKAGSGPDKGSSHKATIQPEPFIEDRIFLQLVSGALFSPTILASRSPVFSYAQTNLRLGWMLTSPSPEKSFFRGNLEAILELSNSIIFNGFGNYIGGITVLVRRNFIQPERRKLIPYFQVGAGVVYNDAYQDRTQNTIGQAIQFTPQGSLGVRYLAGKNWSIDAEFMFQHISNAGLDERNRGLNCAGGFIGITYFTDLFWK